MNQPCPNRPNCDGCPLFDLPESEAQSTKVDAVADVLRSYEWPMDPPDEITVGKRSLGYRNRARMVVKSGKLGFYKKGTRDFIEIDVCPVHNARLEEILGRFRDSSLLNGAEFLDVRVNRSGEAIATVCGEALDLKSWEPDPLVSLHSNLGGREGVILSGTQAVVEGSKALSMSVGGKSFEVEPQAFFQVNPEVQEILESKLRRHLSEMDTIVDYYCGVGVHGVLAAQGASKLIGVDASEAAIQSAKSNAAQSFEGEAVFRAQADTELEWVADEVVGDRVGIIANPSRSGLSVPALKSIIACNPARIAYVSCSAETFFRDAERLQHAGFETIELELFDMMPRTGHVEILGVFERLNKPADSIEHDYWPTTDRHFSDGVSGILGTNGNARWVGIVSGQVPHGQIPKGPDGSSAVMCHRLRRIGKSSVVALECDASVTDKEIRQRMKKWRHPIVGDTEFGDRRLNLKWKQSHSLDRIALHRITADGLSEVVPGGLRRMMKLPLPILMGERSGRR